MFARTSIVAVLGMVGAFALGLTVGPQLDANRYREAPAVAEPAPVPEPVAAPEKPLESWRVTAPKLERVLTAEARPVQQQVKEILNRGTDVKVAAEGFQNARELMTVAHAARNTEIPFVLLKHRVLSERKSLAAAIREFKPELDEAAEVTRARAEAKADLARLSS